MNKRWSHQTNRVGFQLARGVVGFFSLGIAFLNLPAFAQIVPDATLGNESSQVTPNVNVGGSLGDRIDGGAVRGSSLFHSFSEFNVNNGQRVYFADPAGIDNIFSRVTGSNVSNILGTLGVEGAANLFLLNPNGILFGQNARLDIQGSFVASTGDRFVFPGGEEFGASNPQAPPLLTMSVPVGVQYGTQSGRITNEGNLRVGQDLTLAGGTLDLQGQLQAGRDLTLFAQDTVQARDSATHSFRAAAGGTLVVQGNQKVDIVALSHPNSGLFSGGDMVLRSANRVGGDIHYWSGGNFRIETLDGDLGDLFSPGDPVIRASGDVSFDRYQGASLHIFAGGSVTIGKVTITGANTVGNAIAENVTLSDGATLPIDGTTQPTLDIRAGTTAIGTPGITGDTTGFTSGVPGTGGTGTTADITIGSVYFSTPNRNPLPNGGTVFLTNQYSPNSLPAPDGITVGAIDTVGKNYSGSVDIDSKTNLTVNQGISTFTTASYNNSGIGLAGNINLLATGDIVINGYLDASADSSAFSPMPNNSLDRDNPMLVGLAGNVTLKANGNIRLNSDSVIIAYGQFAGFVKLVSDADTFITGSFISAPTLSPPNSNSAQPDSDSTSASSVPGEISITARSFSIKDSSLDVGSFGQGNGGFIKIKATDTILIDNSKLFSDVLREDGGMGGYINISGARIIQISNNSSVVAKSQSEAFAGVILIDASDRIEITNNSEISANGNFGIILVGVGNDSAPQTVVINNSNLTATNGAMDQFAGVILIDASDRIEITNNSEISANGNFGIIGVGVGNDSAPQTVVINNSNLTATNGAMDQFAGGIIIDANDHIEITNNSEISANGNFGIIGVGVGNDSAPQTVVIDNSKLTTNGGNSTNNSVDSVNLPTDSTGMNQVNNVVNNSRSNAGDIEINANRVALNNKAEISATTTNGQAGNITITATNLLLRNESNISTSAGTETTGGNGGTITIDAEDGFVIAVPSENSNIVANAFGGQGGEIKIYANRVLGLKPENRVTTKDALDNIIDNHPSQISAGSDLGFQGTIEINTLTIDPSQGLGELPIEVVDPSGLIAKGCGPTGGTTTNRQSEFVVTGRGGLPPSPNDLQTPGTPSPEWVTRDVGDVTSADIPDEPPTTDTTDTLVEAQGMVKTANGELLLTAEASTVTPDQSGVSPQFCSPVSDRP